MDTINDLIIFMKKNNISEVKFENGYILKVEYTLENVHYKIMNKFRHVLITTIHLEYVVEEIEKYRRVD